MAIESDTPDAREQPTLAAKRLQTALRLLATSQQIAKALGIEDLAAQGEEFLIGQRRAVRRRFLSLCLQRNGMELDLTPEELTSSETEVIADIADIYLAQEGFDYATVRTWFHLRGQFEYSQAVKARRERNRIASMTLRVLFVLEEGGAQYLAYGPNLDDVFLVKDKVRAHQFPVTQSCELEKPWLLSMAKHFDALKSRFGAKEIKVLAQTAQIKGL
jgi:hypothetical protein